MRYTDTQDPLTKTYYRSRYPHVTDFEYGLKIQKLLDGRQKLSTFRSFSKFQMFYCIQYKHRNSILLFHYVFFVSLLAHLYSCTYTGYAGVLVEGRAVFVCRGEEVHVYTCVHSPQLLEERGQNFIVILII